MQTWKCVLCMKWVIRNGVLLRPLPVPADCNSRGARRMRIYDRIFPFPVRTVVGMETSAPFRDFIYEVLLELRKVLTTQPREYLHFYVLLRVIGCNDVG
jgi:hypothetical protein